MYENKAPVQNIDSLSYVCGRDGIDDHVAGWKRMAGMSGETGMNMKIRRGIAYLAAVALLIFYMVMLYHCVNIKVSEDYRQRYIETGYFADPANQK